MASFTIGGKVYSFPPLNIKTIKAIWPFIDAVQKSDDLVALMDATSQILSVILSRSETPMSPEEVEDKMLASEIDGVRASMEDLFVEAGILQRVKAGSPGEGEAASPSTEISTPSSQSLSPQAVPVETGTE